MKDERVVSVEVEALENTYVRVPFRDRNDLAVLYLRAFLEGLEPSTVIDNGDGTYTHVFSARNKNQAGK